MRSVEIQSDRSSSTYAKRGSLTQRPCEQMIMKFPALFHLLFFTSSEVFDHKLTITGVFVKPRTILNCVDALQTKAQHNLQLGIYWLAIVYATSVAHSTQCNL